MAIAQQAQQPNRREPNNPKKPRFAHTDNTKYGMGDFYGTGVRNKIAKVRKGTLGTNPLSQKKLETPPRSLA